jgi:hypothetical protein
MAENKFSFGSASRMKEVPVGEYAELKFGSGDFVKIQTEWGEKYSFPIILFSHPSYESIPKAGIATSWESKSICAKQLYIANQKGAMDKALSGFTEQDFLKALQKDHWKLSRSAEGTYFLDQL